MSPAPDAELLDYLVTKLTISGFALEEIDGSLTAWVRGGDPQEGRLVVKVVDKACQVVANSGVFSGRTKRAFLQQQLDRWCAEWAAGAR